MTNEELAAKYGGMTDEQLAEKYGGVTDEQLQAQQKPGLLSRIGSTASDLGNYLKEKSEPLVSGGEYLGDLAADATVSALQGGTMGLSPSISAGLQVAGESMDEAIGSPINKLSKALGMYTDTPDKQKGTLAERYEQNRNLLQKTMEDVHERSPVVSTIGNIAGGALGGGSVLGALGATEGAAPSIMEIAKNQGKLKALGEIGLRGAKLSSLGAATGGLEGATSSKGSMLTEEGRQQIAEDANQQAMFGAIAAPALHAGFTGLSAGAKSMSKPGNYLADKFPLARKMKRAFIEAEETGINPRSEESRLKYDTQDRTSNLNSTHTKEIIGKYKDIQNEIGGDIEKSLVDATIVGKSIEITPEIKGTLNNLSEVSKQLGGLLKRGEAKEISDRLVKIGNLKNLTPIEAKGVVQDIRSYMRPLENSNYNDLHIDQKVLLNGLQDSEEALMNTINKVVPEHAVHAQRYAQFMRLGPETVMAGEVPEELIGKLASDRINPKLDMYKQMRNIVTKTTKEGNAYDASDTAFGNSMFGLDQFEKAEAKRVADKIIPKSAMKESTQSIADRIKFHADDADIRKTAGAIDPTSMPTSAKGASQMMSGGGGGSGQSFMIGSAIKAGQLSHTINPGAHLSRALYSAPDGTLSSLAEKLKQTPGLTKFGDQLSHALTSPDQMKRNQVLYIIGQHSKINPLAREVINQSTDEEQGQ